MSYHAYVTFELNKKQNNTTIWLFFSAKYSEEYIVHNVAFPGGGGGTGIYMSSIGMCSGEGPSLHDVHLRTPFFSWARTSEPSCIHI